MKILMYYLTHVREMVTDTVVETITDDALQVVTSVTRKSGIPSFRICTKESLKMSHMLMGIGLTIMVPCIVILVRQFFKKKDIEDAKENESEIEKKDHNESQMTDGEVLDSIAEQIHDKMILESSNASLMDEFENVDASSV